MKSSNKGSIFIDISATILKWYTINRRNLPWRENKSPYNIWISEIILQQTRVNQGLEYYIKFIDRFPNVQELANSSTDEVLLYWKGLGYYSRAINLHTAAKQIQNEYFGMFPNNYKELQKLKGVGKYTAAAIASICFNEKTPAVDGNFYRVLSRLFADDFDISKSNAHAYFYELALLIMPDDHPGDFNQAIMDLGSEICKPKNPICNSCPIHEKCLAHQTGKEDFYPVKLKKTKVSEVELNYYYIFHEDLFLIKQRDESSIWKKLWDFPETISNDLGESIIKSNIINHKLSHLDLKINFFSIELNNKEEFEKFAKENHFTILSRKDIDQKSFPKPIHDFIKNKTSQN